MAEAHVALTDGNGAGFKVANWQWTDGNGDTVLGQRVVDALSVGTWGYVAGTSGTEALTGGKRVRQITCVATSAGSLTVNGGDSITIPADAGLDLQINGLLEDPTLVFTGTASYFVQYVT